MSEAAEKEALFQKGLMEYEKGDYFEAHEAWEDLWSDYNLSDRKFIQGLIQLSVSFVHLRNGNMNGARSLLKKCSEKFEPYQHLQRGINMDELKMDIKTVALAYEEIDDPRIFDWDLVPSLKE